MQRHRPLNLHPHPHHHPKKKEKKISRERSNPSVRPPDFFIFARLEKPLKHKIWMRRNKTEAPQINSSVLTTRHGATGGLSRTNRQRVIAGRRAARARSFSFTAPLLSGSVPSLSPGSSPAGSWFHLITAMDATGQAARNNAVTSESLRRDRF